jgi:RNA polymerase sigma factor (sigma-70 family)
MLRSRKAIRSIEGRPATGESNENAVCESVRAVLNKLSVPAREVVFLRFYDGMSYDQISAVLGISEQAINGRLRRAKKKLAEYLRRDGYGEARL